MRFRHGLGQETRELLRTRGSLLGTLMVAAGVAGLAGCGGDGEVSAAEFRDQADAVCAEADEQVTAVPDPESNEDVGAYLDKVVPIVREQTEKLTELDPPEELEEDWNRAMELQQENVDVAEDAQQAAEDGDQQELEETLSRVDENDEELDRLAETLGLDTCGED